MAILIVKDFGIPASRQTPEQKVWNQVSSDMAVQAVQIVVPLDFTSGWEQRFHPDTEVTRVGSSCSRYECLSPEISIVRYKGADILK